MLDLVTSGVDVDLGDSGSQVPLPVLAYLHNMVEEHDMEFPVTLLIGGALVTGKLVSTPAYWQGMADVWRAGNWSDPDIKQSVIRGSELYAYDRAGDENRGSTRFIHLRDGRVLTGRFGPTPGTWLEIDGRAVSACYPGMLNVTSPDPSPSGV